MKKETLALVCILIITSAAQADITTRTVEYHHGDTTLEGYFAWDDSREGPLPGVLIVHEWWGHNDFAREQARRIAQLGYVAFALDMYGKGIRTNDPQEASQLSRPFYAGEFRLMRERARAGLDQLAQHERVDSDRLASIGFCFGGTVSLQLAYNGAPGLKAVVSFHGALPPPAEADDENIRASILVLHGADDPLVPQEQVGGFKSAMQRAGADWQFIAYGGAVHSFTNPGADAHNIPGVAYDESAARRSWAHMQQFFEEKFARDSDASDSP